MGSLTLAFKLFFKTLFDDDLARRARLLFEPEPTAAKPQPTQATPALTAPARSDAITLLAVLQREARLIDFLKENITPYDDAQVGAAVRDVHRDAGATLDRLFALQPVRTEPEGTEIPLPTPLDPNRLRLTGNLTATPPPRGRLQHQGWQATQLDLPQYTGPADASKIIAPAEIEV